MEITNNSRHYAIPLVVGRRIAQIVFFDSAGTVAGRSYTDTGKYQTTTDMDEVMVSLSLSPLLYISIYVPLHLSSTHTVALSHNCVALQTKWKPSDMLPKMYLDSRKKAQEEQSSASTDEPVATN